MVLEAWEGAEKVGFPVLGEEIKDASNVVDYNINKEITINTSATWNANNETTTGQATTIYGVNAPKIIDNTSIYTKNYNWLGSISVSTSMPAPVPYGGSVSKIFQNLTLSSLDGRYNFWIGSVNIGGTIYNNSIIYIPEDGVYKIEGKMDISSSSIVATMNMYKDEYPGTLLKSASAQGVSSFTTDVTVNLKKLDYVRFSFKLESLGGAFPSYTQGFWLTITKIG